MDDQEIVTPGDAADPLILSIDVGSSSARALVYDGRARGVVGWEAHTPYVLSTTAGGGVEAHPDDLAQLVARCLDILHAQMKGSGRRIAAVACDTFWHSLMGVDVHGKALTPLYTWADTRSSQAADHLRRLVDDRAVHARTGAVIHSSYLPAKLLWLRETNASLFHQVTWWMSFGEYLYLHLFGQRRVSISMASATGLFDQNTCTWDPELLSVLEIDPDQLSPIADYTEAMSHLQPDFARRWPELDQVPWYLALGDGACNNIGSGGYCPEWLVAMIGTSGALRVVRAADHVEVPPGLWSYRVDRRRIVQGAALSDGGNVFAWLHKILQLPPIPELEDRLARMAPAAHGLTVLPFLAGERSPGWAANAQSTIVGMTLDTDPVDIVRAYLEAVACRFGMVYGVLRRVIAEPQGIIGSGTGLISSVAWMQIMTDVLGEPLVASGVSEATSRGAALLALQAQGAISDLASLPAPLGTTYHPIPAHTRIYAGACRRQQELYQLLIGSGQGLDTRASRP